VMMITVIEIHKNTRYFGHIYSDRHQ